MADSAHITPKVLKWARESARMSAETAAAKIPVSVEKLYAWEAGEALPTIRQAQTLATAYKRPFALFFLPAVPLDFTPLQDFRKPGAAPLSTASLFIIREIQGKQAWMAEVMEEAGEPKLPFIGKFSPEDPPQTVATHMLETLGVRPGKYVSEKPLKEWIMAAERQGIFVSSASHIHTRMKLDSDELQGFAIADNYAPFIFLNADDWDAPQLFTLVHELAHLWIAATGVSSDVAEIARHRKKFHPVEQFCNEVAAHALMPEKAMRALDAQTFQSAAHLMPTAKKWGVSNFALLLRMQKLNLLTPREYGRLKAQADRAFQTFVQEHDEKKAAAKAAGKKGGPDYNLLMLNRNGRLFTQTVLDFYRGGLIPPTEASKLLQVQTNKFPKLEKYLYA